MNSQPGVAWYRGRAREARGLRRCSTGVVGIVVVEMPMLAYGPSQPLFSARANSLERDRCRIVALVGAPVCGQGAAHAAIVWSPHAWDEARRGAVVVDAAQRRGIGSSTSLLAARGSLKPKRAASTSSPRRSSESSCELASPEPPSDRAIGQETKRAGRRSTPPFLSCPKPEA